MKAQLECRNVSLNRSVPGRDLAILSSICATFQQQSISIIQGASGSGKTSLLHLLCGLLRPTSGLILLEEIPISRWTVAFQDRWRRQTGIVLQSPHLLTNETVFDNILLPIIPRVRNLAIANTMVMRALELTELTWAASLSAGILSGGESQRAALARAIVGKPEWLFADEPTAHQDASGVTLVIRILETMADQGTGIVLSSHDPRLNEALRADARFVLVDGTLIRD